MNNSIHSNRLINCLLLTSVLTTIVVAASAQITADTSNVDSSLLKQVEQELQNTTPASPRSGISANPDISAIGDFQGSYNSIAERNFDLYLHEAELSLQAVVDPYVRADFFLSFGRDPDTYKYGVEVEEGYVTTLSLPAHLQLKAGKFKEALGRINPVHSHALPFIDMPNAFVNYFGEEGLNDEGLSLSWLLPNSAFYQELVLQATAGFSETPSFMRNAGNRFIYLGHLKNFWNLTDNATLEFGLTGITGPNDSSLNSNIGAADLTYKWKPVRLNTYHSLTWQSEFFFSNAKLSENSTVNSFGLYSFLQYQIAKRWFATVRYDYAQQPHSSTLNEQAYSATFEWYATEFQKIGLEGKFTDPNEGKSFFEGWLRWIFVIGTHGAHQY